MRVVITGASGFLGRVVLEQLTGVGDDVLGIDTEIDLRDPARVREVIASAEPEVVVHLGGISGPMVAADDPGLVTAVNAVGTVNVLDACQRLANRPCVVLASSVAAVERLGGNEPITVYAATKRFVEDAAAAFRSRGLAATSVRIGSLYGPGRQTHHIITDIADSLRTTGFVRLGRDAQEPLVHVQDAARFLVRLVQLRRVAALPYDLVQATVGHPEIAQQVATALRLPLSMELIERQEVAWSEPLDHRSLRADTGLDFSIPVADGIAQLLTT